MKLTLWAHTSRFAILGVLLSFSAVAYAGDIRPLLSLRDGRVSWAELERAAGSEDNLVQQLLNLREDTSHPYVGVRAEKLLLKLSSRREVADALREDLLRSEHQPRLRALLSNLDQVGDANLRLELARSFAERAKVEKRMVPHARILLKSSSPNVRETARTILGGP